MDNYTIEIVGGNASFTVNDLTMNGTNYVSETEVDTTGWPTVFKFIAKDSEGNVTETYDHAKLIQQESYAWDGGKFYLAFAPVSAQEIKNAEFQANLEYLAMMSDIELEE